MAYAADKKPGELTALTVLATDDVFVVGDTSDASEVAKGITKANLITDLSSSFTLISSGTAAPLTTPTHVGHLFVDTANGNIYLAKGVTSAADWVQVNN